MENVVEGSNNLIDHVPQRARYVKIVAVQDHVQNETKQILECNHGIMYMTRSGDLSAPAPLSHLLNRLRQS